MDKRDLREKDDIFIVEVTGTASKTINIPKVVCEFCGLRDGDIIKIKVLEILSKEEGKKKK
jgi:hypothetical protein